MFISFAAVINRHIVGKNDTHVLSYMDFLGGLALKNLLANAGDVCFIPGLGRSPKEEMATQSSILAWESPWTEEPGRLQSMGL